MKKQDDVISCVHSREIDGKRKCMLKDLGTLEATPRWCKAFCSKYAPIGGKDEDYIIGQIDITELLQEDHGHDA